MKIFVFICIDGVHVVHVDVKGHSILFITIGRVSMINVQKKPDLVSTSSIEAKVVTKVERFPNEFGLGISG